MTFDLTSLHRECVRAPFLECLFPVPCPHPEKATNHYWFWGGGVVIISLRMLIENCVSVICLRESRRREQGLLLKV